jgi:hypothetical protein
MKFAYVDESGVKSDCDVFVMGGVLVDAYRLPRYTEAARSDKTREGGSDIHQIAFTAMIGFAGLNPSNALTTALLDREMVSTRAPRGWHRQNVRPPEACRHI